MTHLKGLDHEPATPRSDHEAGQGEQTEGSDLAHTAIDEQLRPGDETGLVAREEELDKPGN